MSAQAPLTLNLTWTNGSILGTGFTIQRATNSTFSSGLTTINITPGTLTSYVNTGTFATSTTYYYRIRATNGTNVSPWSATASVRVAYPSSPSNLAAANASNPLRINLTWTDNSTVEAGFTLQKATNSTFTGATNIDVAPSPASGATVTYVDNAVVANTRYYYRVRSYNGVGSLAWSNTVNILTPGGTATVPGAPTGVTAVAGNAQASVSFTAPASNGGSAITGYTVTSSPAGGTDTNAGTTALTHLITGLTNGTAYTFTVRATNTVGTGPASSPSNSVTPTASAVPLAPSNLAATAVVSGTSAVVTLTWRDNSTNETGFTLQRALNSGFTSGLSTRKFTSNTTTNQWTLSRGITYYFRICATNASGQSAWSNVVSITTP
jgi:hypothetical protein